jgi:hypothetical protein
MNSFQVSLIVLLVIIILTCTLASYKIETFSEEPKNPNAPTNMSAYDFLIQIKKWNGIASLQREHLLVLFTMRTVVGKYYASNNRKFPYFNGLVIPYQHMPLFNRDPNDRSQMIFEVAEGLKTITAEPTSNKMYPSGFYINLDNVTYDDFKDILDILYRQYDYEYLENLEILKNIKEDMSKQVRSVEELRDNLKYELEKKKQKLTEITEVYDKEMVESERLKQEMTKFRACG